MLRQNHVLRAHFYAPYDFSIFDCGDAAIENGLFIIGGKN